METENQPYIINYNGTEIEIERPDIFAYSSKLFKGLYQQNPTGFDVPNAVYSIQVFRLFCTACQSKPFSAHLDDIFEFRQIAIDWEVDNLVNYCNSYIEKTKIKELSVDEIFEELQQAQASKDKDQIKYAVRDAATKFSEVFSDPERRLEQIDTDIICHIISSVNTTDENSQVLANFVVELFKTNPTKATQLFPRLDFDKLTGKQYAVIFKPDAIECAMNYYNAYAISDAHKELKTALKTFDTTASNNLKNHKARYQKNFERIFDTTKKSRRSDLNKIRMRLVQQNEDLNDLAEVLENQKALLVDCVKICHRAPSAAEYLQKSQKDIIEMILDKKAELLNQIQQDQDDSESALMRKLQEAQNEIERETEGKVIVSEEVKSGVSNYKQRFADIKNSLVSLAHQIKEENAAVMAKIIRDNLRGNEYLRVVRDNQGNPLAYKLFDDLESKDLWDLTKEDVRTAETKIIIPIETKLDKECGLRK